MAKSRDGTPSSSAFAAQRKLKRPYRVGIVLYHFSLGQTCQLDRKYLFEIGK